MSTAGGSGPTQVRGGDNSSLTGAWISSADNNIFLETRLYAISSVLTVIPEPGTATLLMLGLFWLSGMRRHV